MYVILNIVHLVSRTSVTKHWFVLCWSMHLLFGHLTKLYLISERLNLPSLESRRVCNWAIMMFKMLNNIVDIPIDLSILVLNTLPTQGHNLRFRQLSFRINSFGKSFFPDSIRIWNQLPTSLVNCNDLDSFKLQLYTTNCIQLWVWNIWYFLMSLVHFLMFWWIRNRKIKLLAIHWSVK